MGSRLLRTGPPNGPFLPVVSVQPTRWGRDAVSEPSTAQGPRPSWPHPPRWRKDGGQMRVPEDGEEGQAIRLALGSPGTVSCVPSPRPTQLTVPARFQWAVGSFPAEDTS